MNFKRGAERTLNVTLRNPASAAVTGVVSVLANPWKREGRKTSVGQTFHSMRATSSAVKSELDHAVVVESLAKQNEAVTP